MAWIYSSFHIDSHLFFFKPSSAVLVGQTMKVFCTSALASFVKFLIYHFIQSIVNAPNCSQLILKTIHHCETKLHWPHFCILHYNHTHLKFLTNHKKVQGNLKVQENKCWCPDEQKTSIAGLQEYNDVICFCRPGRENKFLCSCGICSGRRFTEKCWDLLKQQCGAEDRFAFINVICLFSALLCRWLLSDFTIFQQHLRAAGLWCFCVSCLWDLWSQRRYAAIPTAFSLH